MTVAPGSDEQVCRVAGAIAEPARARILFSLMDNRARTSTELAMIANVSPSTASAHLNRLKDERLVKVTAQGKHRYYRLAGEEIADLLESLSVLAGKSCKEFVPSTPAELLAARTCYDHVAGRLGVGLHDRLMTMHCLSPAKPDGDNAYELTSAGVKMLSKLGVDVEAIRDARRRFAFGCIDWSERKPHLGGAVGAALLKLLLENGWVDRDIESRALFVTRRGNRELLAHFGLHV